FFFLAEDGIRDFHVTGVQTCALPISRQAPENRQQAAIDQTEFVTEKEWLGSEHWRNRAEARTQLGACRLAPSLIGTRIEQAVGQDRQSVVEAESSSPGGRLIVRGEHG